MEVGVGCLYRERFAVLFAAPTFFQLAQHNTSRKNINISGTLFYLPMIRWLLLKAGRVWEEVCNADSLDIGLIKNWLDRNVLIMNVSKTKCFAISLRARGGPAADLRLVLHFCGAPIGAAMILSCY